MHLDRCTPSADGLVVPVIVFFVRDPLGHGHGFVGSLGDVLVVGVGQVNDDAPGLPGAAFFSLSGERPGG